MTDWMRRRWRDSRSVSMVSIHECVPSALAELLRRQPRSAARVSFAWRTAVGEAIARASTVALADNGTLTVRAADQHWRHEIARAAPVILARLRPLLGEPTITRMAVEAPPDRHTRVTRAGRPPARRP